MTDEQIIQFLKDNIDYMINNDLILYLFRQVGWVIAKLLSSLITVGKSLYDFTFGLVDISKWTGLENWLAEFAPLVQLVVLVSLVALGGMYMFGKNKKHNVLTSILIFAVVATSSSYLFTQFSSWAVVFKDAVVSGEGTADGMNLMNSNLYDLYYIDQEIGLKNMSDSDRPQYSSLTEADMKYMNIAETLEWDDVEDPDTKDILKKRLRFRGGGGDELQDVYNGVAWSTIGNDFYFRYKFNWGTYFLDALAVILIYFCLSYKNVRITYELIMGRLLVTLKAGDLSSKKKLVKILECVRDEYYALCFTAVTVRTYFLFTDYLKQSAGSHGITRGVVTLFIAFCVIDGSNILQKITGVDAGLSSMTGKLIAGSHMLQGLQSMVNQHRMNKHFSAQASQATKERKNGEKGAAGGNGSAKAMDNDLGHQQEKQGKQFSNGGTADMGNTGHGMNEDLNKKDKTTSNGGKEGNSESANLNKGVGHTDGSENIDYMDQDLEKVDGKQDPGAGGEDTMQQMDQEMVNNENGMPGAEPNCESNSETMRGDVQDRGNTDSAGSTGQHGDTEGMEKEKNTGFEGMNRHMDSQDRPMKDIQEDSMFQRWANKAKVRGAEPFSTPEGRKTRPDYGNGGQGGHRANHTDKGYAPSAGRKNGSDPRGSQTANRTGRADDSGHVGSQTGNKSGTDRTGYNNAVNSQPRNKPDKGSGRHRYVGGEVSRKQRKKKEE